MSRRRRRAMPRCRCRGQATVELALVLPLLVALLLFGVQVGLIVRDEIMVVNAARAGARAAAVSAVPGEARAAAEQSGQLDPGRLEVQARRAGEYVTVSVRYLSVTAVPLIGPLLGDIALEESTTMRIEDG